ncbi:hypothetical protein CLV98_103144 [Dyadobacter jejuensis]|uniref:Uncharacterized protein n=1 Tax=Dyadobacter jejuensis TaxID=1082580 RepID=A0A316B857_9BACT|nr:hypothetical protein [Dyadobacter jejuensis]PWJ58777.1 hypothetical protein CLV98_103144 [Dyadobacter jejuensis]
MKTYPIKTKDANSPGSKLTKTEALMRRLALLLALVSVFFFFFKILFF